MYFDDVVSLFTMAGHGGYVWSAYAFATLILLYNVLAPLFIEKKVLMQVRRQQQLKRQQSLDGSMLSKSKHATTQRTGAREDGLK